MTLAISLIVTILNMYTGFRATDPEKVRLMRTLGATRRQILWMLVFPRQLPHPVFHAEGQRGPVVGGRHHG